ncbi:MAG: PDZ domain-containing protein [Crocinitomicaceae bacterium]|nr:PDZ domain-containing protein [Crocinitomicaceae bacterium]
MVLTTITENSNASKADLKTNDVILELNGKTISSVAEFQGLLALQNPGDRIKLTIQRGTNSKEFELRLE